MSKKSEILRLRANGKPYNEIAKTVGCSKSLVCYYCSETESQKTRDRQRKRREGNVLVSKVDAFKGRALPFKLKDFQRKRTVGGHYYVNGCRENGFTLTDVLDKIGPSPQCYLTGRQINLAEPKTYSFDHVVPVSRGGTLELFNLGLVCREANHAKHDRTLEELLTLCTEILTHHGYKVTRE